MSKSSEKFNELPYEIRNICAINEAEMRINQLIMEKGRLKKRYEQSIKECNSHINNLKVWIKQEERSL